MMGQENRQLQFARLMETQIRCPPASSGGGGRRKQTTMVLFELQLRVSVKVHGGLFMRGGWDSSIPASRSQSLLVFTATSDGDFSYWHWKPGLGSLVWVWDPSLFRGTSTA